MGSRWDGEQESVRGAERDFVGYCMMWTAYVTCLPHRPPARDLKLCLWVLEKRTREASCGLQSIAIAYNVHALFKRCRSAVEASGWLSQSRQGGRIGPSAPFSWRPEKWQVGSSFAQRRPSASIGTQTADDHVERSHRSWKKRVHCQRCAQALIPHIHRPP